MVKGLLFIILLVIIIGAVILLIAVNFVLSIFRRIRRGGYDDDYDDNNDYVRRHSNQYNFRGTTTSYSRNTSSEQPRQQYEYVNNPGNTYNSSNVGGQEIIFDTRDAHVANRQIISDDEGEYVDFVEEK